MTEELPTRSRRGFVAGIIGSAMLLFFLLSIPGMPTDVSNVASDEHLVFFPTHAAYDARKDVWRIHLHGWLFEPERGSLKRRALKAAVREAMDVPDDAAARKLFDSRIDPFLVDNERGKNVVVRIGRQRFSLGQTASDGHVEKTIEVPANLMASWQKKSDSDGRGISFEAALPKRDSRQFTGRILVIPDRGLSVISDIDDTIKITNVTDRKALLANTFYRPFQPVPGMPQLYRDLEKGGAAFHYVSASPWQLSGALMAMLDKARFPRGSLHLRNFRLQNVRSLDDLAGKNSKQPKIERLIKENPRRRFVLFGDSGERDPEIYGALVRKYPDQIAGVFIRNVTRESPEDKRFREAFDKVDAAKWTLFDKPADVRPRLRVMSLLKTTAE